MAAPSPPQQQEESVSFSSKKKKQKRTKHDLEVERLGSLPWNSSLPDKEEDDTFSLFIGSGDLDGGYPYKRTRSHLYFLLKLMFHVLNFRTWLLLV